MRGRLIRRAIFLAGLIVVAGLSRAAEVEQVYTIPLERFTYSSSEGTPYFKYGIWLSLGSAATPQVFEFDTGGEGFYAAYADGVSWWGSDVTVDSTDIDKNFDSGLRYTGKVAKTSVAFYGSSSSAMIFQTNASDYKTGLTDHIVDTHTDTHLWPEQDQTPPVKDSFYGDFGMSLKKGDHGIENMLAQLTYGKGVTAGYIISLGANASQAPSVQMGLSASDLTNPDTIWFRMTPGANGETFEHSDLPTFAAELIDADVTLAPQSGDPVTLSGLGLNLDTGATPTIHYQKNSADEAALTPLSLVENDELKALIQGLQLTITGTDVNGGSVTLDQFTTESDHGSNLVAEKPRGDNDPTYLNVGQLLFENYAVTYDLENGQIGFTPYTVPEPGAAGLLLVGTAGTLAAWRRLKSRG